MLKSCNNCANFGEDGEGCDPGHKFEYGCSRMFAIGCVDTRDDQEQLWHKVAVCVATACEGYERIVEDQETT